jgi:beta-galactosidase
MPSDVLVEKLLAEAVSRAGVTHPSAGFQFPVIVRSGVNSRGRPIHYLLNYSADSRALAYPFGAGVDLLSEKSISTNERLNLEKWGVAIVEESPAR